MQGAQLLRDRLIYFLRSRLLLLFFVAGKILFSTLTSVLVTADERRILGSVTWNDMMHRRAFVLRGLGWAWPGRAEVGSAVFLLDWWRHRPVGVG